MKKSLEEKIRFDGKETREDADQYVDRCKGRAVNLYVYLMGNYIGCGGCEYRAECLKSARTAGEQAGL